MKRIIKVMMVVVTIMFIFNFSFRYKMAEVDNYEIRDDLLALKIYVKHKDSSVWSETKFKSLSHAKAYFEKKVLLAKTTWEPFFWWAEEQED